MNQRLEFFKKNIKGKDIAVIGLGISNLPLIKFLAAAGAKVNVCDMKSQDAFGDVCDELSELGVSFSLGTGYLDNLNQEIIFKTPGMRFDIPPLCRARDMGAFVTSEMELFFDLCPAPIIGVTGSDGKTTTTTLIYKMLSEQGCCAWLGGNIGKPLIGDVDNIKETDRVVLELSSFQLHTMKVSPQTAVITNITPNHLDMHKDYEEYIDAKRNIMRYQTPNSRLVINFDNEHTRKIGQCAAGECVYFSSSTELENGLYLKENMIYHKDKPLLAISDIQILGKHNIENYMAAIGAVYDMVSADCIKNVAKNFFGVAHRNELVRILNGVKYYNSSIDSSPNRTKNTLSVFNEKVILICGGKEKGIPYDDLGLTLVEKVKVLILIGSSADKIEAALNKQINQTGRGKDIMVVRVCTYEDAVREAFKLAKSGDSVVLSPASTSFDMFANFEERGDLFKKLVNEL
ncbi:MAG: UDP-N-acetylmuramoyl-L-alanine--D-glutamate ligase [Clostridia bacterium]|nr:UDP-N-acetylmuramoyl-L-alanine--D-glutamate ligase [Clostridia bacterium]